MLKISSVIYYSRLCHKLHRNFTDIRGHDVFETRLTKYHYVHYWHLGHVKFVVGAMSFKSPPKLYFWGYQSWGAIPSMADSNCDGMSTDHRDESLTVDYSPLYCFSPTLNPINHSANHRYQIYTVYQ